MKLKKFSTKNLVLTGVMLMLIIGLFVTYVLAQEIYSDTMQLNKGWNLISVRPGMDGKSLADAVNLNRAIANAEECRLNAGWLFQNGKWLLVKPTTGKFTKPPFDSAVDVVEFDLSHVGLGMWVKVENENACKLGCGLTSCMSDVAGGTIKDDTPPTITLTPDNNFRLPLDGTTTFKVTASDNGSGLKSCSYTVRNYLDRPFGEPKTETFDCSGGEFIFEFEVTTDENGICNFNGDSVCVITACAFDNAGLSSCTGSIADPKSKIPGAYYNVGTCTNTGVLIKGVTFNKDTKRSYVKVVNSGSWDYYVVAVQRAFDRTLESPTLTAWNIDSEGNYYIYSRQELSGSTSGASYTRSPIFKLIRGQEKTIEIPDVTIDNTFFSSCPGDIYNGLSYAIVQSSCRNTDFFGSRPTEIIKCIPDD
ncbi:MAG: hypothetical protein IH934_06155 [Nanoarchaeota archaeon]|nr:hypothetical protein [Nanoarchaeota archaeon]